MSSTRGSATAPAPAMVWHGWGDPDHPRHLDVSAERFLRAQLGGFGAPAQPVALDAVHVPPSALTPAQRDALAAVVGADHVRDDHPTRVHHAGGKSYPDLIRRRRGDAGAAPDAVVFPGSHAEVTRVLAACVRERIAVVPFGGGTSVVGGVEPRRGPFEALITVDLSRMNRVLAVDAESRIAVMEPGLRGRDAEAELRSHGFTLGHFPQSFEYATVGGFVATRSAGQASTGYGRIDDMVVGVVMATPEGDLRVTRDTPTAAGPDLLQLVAGSEGTFGIVTEVSLRVAPAPETQDHRMWAVRSFAEGAALLRELVQAGAAPDITRLSDEHETRTTVAQLRGWRRDAVRRYLRLRGLHRPCVVLLGWEGTAARLAQRRRAAAGVLRKAGAVALGGAPGRAWVASRFAGPYLRDALIDRGVLVETLETASRWSAIDGLYASVRDALTQTLTARGTPPLVLCHVSHVYETGASLYFTWLARAVAGAELDQWHAAKQAASDAIVAAGGTITHHHAVGTDHRPWMHDEVGALGVRALAAVKDAFDPSGVLNPGKLIPSGRDMLPRHGRPGPSAHGGV